MADNTLDMLRAYTPQEINQLQQILSQRYQEGALQNQTMNTVANMTKNLSPAANLGIALGTLGGKWAAQRYNDLVDKEIWENRRRGERIKEFLNWANPTGNYGPKYYGTGLPTEGAYISQLPYYLPNNKFYVNGDELNFGAKWQRPDTTPTDTTPANNVNPTNITSNSTSVLTGGKQPFDWRNQRYFNVENPFAKKTYNPSSLFHYNPNN